jgi:hypothetical protein
MSVYISELGDGQRFNLYAAGDSWVVAAFSTPMFRGRLLTRAAQYRDREVRMNV